MKAWRLAGLGGELCFADVPKPEPRPGSALVRIEASLVLSYLKPYVEGKLPMYNPPPGAFTIGTDGVGTVEAIGREVWGVRPGQRVVISPRFFPRENVAEPPEVLIGLTSISPGAEPVLADWPDGTFAEYALLPVEAITPAEGLDQVSAAQLAVLGRCIVPFGGLLRGRLAVGETLIVIGATGAYGGAAVLLGLALGAARVVAAGRNPTKLAAVARACGPRVSPVPLTGDVQADANALRAASNGGAEMAFDMVGQARDSNATLAALRSLRRGGRLVLMGSMSVELPVSYTVIMLNSLEILGQYMYPVSAYGRLLGLLRSGQLDLSPIQPRVYPLPALREAMDAAAVAGNLECVVVQA
jgi:alcohol dehydrogenase